MLGAGGFGRVTLVRRKGDAGGACYALKQMAKAYIKAQGLVRHVHREKQVGRLRGLWDCFGPRLLATPRLAHRGGHVGLACWE